MRLSFLVFLLLCVSLAYAIDEDGKKIEENVLIQADKDIEKYRKSDAVIEVVNKKGKPVKEAIVKVNQTNSDFLFSANVTLITGDLGGKIPIEHYLFQPRLKTQAEEDEFKKKVC